MCSASAVKLKPLGVPEAATCTHPLREPTAPPRPACPHHPPSAPVPAGAQVLFAIVLKAEFFRRVSY